MQRPIEHFGPPLPRIGLSPDAVVIVPGIMGSTLIEASTGRELWGMTKAIEYALRWRQSGGMTALAVTDDERSGRIGRVVPRGLLRKPAWAPFLGGIEPYTRLVKELRKAVVDPAAICEFAYDWRLPVSYNATLLADCVHRHLHAWRAHPAHDRARAGNDDDRPAQAVIIAHSMGGLLVRSMTLIPGAAAEVRATLTLGTPFEGSVMAAQILNSGRGGPPGIPRRQLRDLGRTLPGLHDLLPTYRCVETDDEVVALTPGDVEAIGGDPELARDAFETHARAAAASLPGHLLVAGVAQPTVQSLRIRAGIVEPNMYAFRRHPDGELRRDALGRPLRFDYHGDGTVYRYAAYLRGVEAVTVAQQHGALAATGAVTDIARGLVNRVTDLGEVLGAEFLELGLDVPELVATGAAFDILVAGKVEPGSMSCRIEDAGSRDRIVQRPRLTRVRSMPGHLSVRVTLDDPGLYRVKVAGGSDPVSRMVLVTAGGGGDTR
ncbi:MAG TPA: hypothetical protein VGZ32_25720 [Actinocrinis sp.]|jgi:hypothetical protein|uniref:PGAP1-like alpha/beta domain-containing protein n=1 Tax=Actinocrinis sp. TaxID=1920516 RepID=UPI002DDCFF48|nr:hypothetical protein [Actinocrinis sp.]HEV3173775.1 hypothetical protein [Actinocrinis sp.]